jgi:hypothetical protein
VAGISREGPEEKIGQQRRIISKLRQEWRILWIFPEINPDYMPVCDNFIIKGDERIFPEVSLNFIIFSPCSSSEPFHFDFGLQCVYHQYFGRNVFFSL